MSPAEKRAEWIRLYTIESRTTRQIAAQYGNDCRAVARVLVAAGVTLRKPGAQSKAAKRARREAARS